jgi:hypothetical protein
MGNLSPPGGVAEPCLSTCTVAPSYGADLARMTLPLPGWMTTTKVSFEGCGGGPPASGDLGRLQLRA